MLYNGTYDPVELAIDLIRNDRFLGIKVGRHGSDEERKATDILLGELARFDSELRHQQRYEKVISLLSEYLRHDRSVNMMNHFPFESLRGRVGLGETFAVHYSSKLIAMNPDSIKGIEKAKKEIEKRGIPVDRPSTVAPDDEREALLAAYKKDDVGRQGSYGSSSRPVQAALAAYSPTMPAAKSDASSMSMGEAKA